MVAQPAAEPFSARTLLQSQSPRSAKGVLTSCFEEKFGTANPLKQAPHEEPPPPTPRGTKPGLTTFTDAQNPFNRNVSKHIVRIDLTRADATRAGTRTRNPGMIPSERARSAEPGQRFVPYRFSTGPDYKPSKAVGSARPAERESPLSSCGEPNSSPPSAAVGRQLANYLNDMKGSGTSRRVHKDWAPSPALQKMNDRKVKLVTELRSESCERSTGPPSPAATAAARERAVERGRSASCLPVSPRGPDEERAQMFARKRRPSEGPASLAASRSAALAEDGISDTSSVASYGACNTPRLSTTRSFLQHDEDDHGTMRAARESSLRRTQRLEKADKRSERINQHMRTTFTEGRQSFTEFRNRGLQGTGIFAHVDTRVTA
eukprot:TRINITY_DN16457_c0_g1_i1.p1 TRINITY_DN16457_c0_g1~~TRINITY_DN16457_c0_g1_i1.p1  ORF type:complete len:377 (+),score=69.39 TRINITY_DN16457_c0_g1_i1:77-1207(+)